MAQEVFVVGLGEFGKKVVSLVEGFIEERRSQMDPIQKDSVIARCLSFTSGDFSYQKIVSEFTTAARDSNAKRFGEQFNYIFVGNVAEAFTATYAVDFAFIPKLMDQDRVLFCNKSIAFWTFADELGVTEKASNETMAGIRKFFVDLEKIDNENCYKAPFKDAGGKEFNPIHCSYGPFERNYVMITPGNSDSVTKETSNIFAERIFFELYYLSDTYEKKFQEVKAQLVSETTNGSSFSTFSMIQVSRIAQLQEYYLKSRLSQRIIKYYLGDERKTPDKGFFERKFFDMMDIPHGKDKKGNILKFPIERAVKLFFNKNDFKGILTPFISRDADDYNDYVSQCKLRMDDRLEAITPKYYSFVQEEMHNLLGVIKKGIVSLLRIDRFAGNIQTYKAYLKLLDEKLHSWEEDLKEYRKQLEEFDIDPYYEEAGIQIERLQRKKIFKFPLFTPLRTIAIGKVINSVPVEEYIKNKIEKSLVDTFLNYFENAAEGEAHPAIYCSTVTKNFERIEEKLRALQVSAENKEYFIRNLNSYYYVLSPVKDAEYNDILSRIDHKNFDPEKLPEYDKLAVDKFKEWTSKKDLVDITEKPDAFIEHINNIVNEHFAGIQANRQIEMDVERDDRFAKASLKDMVNRSESLNKRSFFVSEGNYIQKNTTLLAPVMEKEDLLAGYLDDIDSMVQQVPVPLSFTNGSLVYFSDYLYMNRRLLQKYDHLEDYKDAALLLPKYAEEKTDFNPSVANADMTKADKYVRALLLDYVSEKTRLEMFNEKFSLSEKSLADENVNALAKVVDIARVVNILTQEQLEEYAKNYGITYSEDRDRMIKLIKHMIEKQSK